MLDDPTDRIRPPPRVARHVTLGAAAVVARNQANSTPGILTRTTSPSVNGRSHANHPSPSSSAARIGSIPSSATRTRTMSSGRSAAKVRTASRNAARFSTATCSLASSRGEGPLLITRTTVEPTRAARGCSWPPSPVSRDAIALHDRGREPPVRRQHAATATIAGTMTGRTASTATAPAATAEPAKSWPPTRLSCNTTNRPLGSQLSANRTWTWTRSRSSPQTGRSLVHRRPARGASGAVCDAAMPKAAAQTW